MTEQPRQRLDSERLDEWRLGLQLATARVGASCILQHLTRSPPKAIVARKRDFKGDFDLLTEQVGAGMNLAIQQGC